MKNWGRGNKNAYPPGYFTLMRLYILLSIWFHKVGVKYVRIYNIWCMKNEELICMHVYLGIYVYDYKMQIKPLKSINKGKNMILYIHVGHKGRKKRVRIIHFLFSERQFIPHWFQLSFVMYFNYVYKICHNWFVLRKIVR